MNYLNNNNIKTINLIMVKKHNKISNILILNKITMLTTK